jgi:hypothetical protein
MKLFLSLLMLCSFTVHADLIYKKVNSSAKTTLIGHINDLDDRADVLEATAGESAYVSEGAHAKRLVKFSYSVVTDGGAPGLHSTGVTLPAGAIITQNYFWVESSIVPGTATISAQCEDNANLLASGTIPAGSIVNSKFAGAATGTAANFVTGIGAACAINVSIATGNLTVTGGTLSGWVEYVTEDN